jgi:RNA recognition motif-containing protein
MQSTFKMKGFAFVQYNDQMDAMNAVFAQDGQLLAGQAIGIIL